MQGESEFAFGHALARDVAYGQLPRASVRGSTPPRRRGSRARPAIAPRTSPRSSRTTTRRRSSSPAPPARRTSRTCLWSRRSATWRSPAIVRCRWTWPRRSATTHSPWTWPPVTVLRGPICWRDGGRRSTCAGDLWRPSRPWRKPSSGCELPVNPEQPLLAQMLLGYAVSDMDQERWHRLQAEAVTSLEADGPSPELLAALNDRVGSTWGRADPQATIAAAEHAIATADALGVPPDPRAICYRGCARCDMGDAGGLDDLRSALEIVRAGGGDEHAGDVFWAAGMEVVLVRRLSGGAGDPQGGSRLRAAPRRRGHASSPCAAASSGRRNRWGSGTRSCMRLQSWNPYWRPAPTGGCSP